MQRAEIGDRDDGAFRECATGERGDHLTHIGVLRQDGAVERRADHRVLQRNLRRLERGLRNGNPRLHPLQPRVRGIVRRLRGEVAVQQRLFPRHRPLGIAQLGAAQREVGLRLCQLRPDIGIFDPGKHLPRSHAVALDDTEIHETAGALGRHGGFPLRDDIAAGDHDRPGPHRRHHRRGREVDGDGGTEGAAGEQQRGHEHDGASGAHTDQDPEPAIRRGRGPVGGAVDPQGGEVRVLSFHAAQS